jgi:complex III assembly factor LYRM7
MTESRLAIRAQFESNRHVDTLSRQGQSHMEGLLTMIDEAEDMLLHGIARGTLNEDKGHYEVKIRPEQAERIGEDDSVVGTTLEPITAETGGGEGTQKTPKVTVTTSSSSTSCSTTK